MPQMVGVKTPGEYTKVNLETEVKIPWETYKKLLVLGPVSIWCFWIAGWLVWMRVGWAEVGLWRWASREWWPWFAGGGVTWPVLMCVLWWGSAPTWATIYRFFVETIVKQTPQYTAYPAENGRWRPFARQQQEVEYEAETEAPAEAIDVNLTTRAPGRKRPQIRTLPKFPMGRHEKSFYAAVGRGAPFTEREASRHWVSQNVFKHHIREALQARQLAPWKNERFHNQGVNLSDEGRALLDTLGRR